MPSLNSDPRPYCEPENGFVKTPPMRSARLRTCTLCARTFTPSSNHNVCPACRQKLRRDACTCGTLKTRRAKTCLKCRAEVGASDGSWRGGTVKHRAGYVLRRVPTHPKAK